jgi:phage/plasmid-like protein (TIGR03299 family)
VERQRTVTKISLHLKGKIMNDRSIRRTIAGHARGGNFTRFDDNEIVSVEEALVRSGCNWDVEERVVGFSTADFNAKGLQDHHWSTAPKHKALIRQDTGAMLGLVGKGYGVLNNSKAFDFLSPWIQEGKARIRKAGFTGDGQRVVLEALILDSNGQPQRVPVDAEGRDTVENRLIVYNSHDGGSSVTAGLAPYRLICSNGMMILVPEFSAIVKMRHTSSLEMRLAKFQRFLTDADRSFDELLNVFRVMADKRMSMEQFETYAKQVLNWTDAKAAESKLDEPRAMDKLRSLFVNGKGSKMSTANFTTFGAYNAFTAWLSHERGKDSTRYEMSNFGSGPKVRTDAFKAALSFATS